MINSALLLKMILEGIQACAVSLSAKENVVDISPQEEQEINAIYRRLHKIQMRVATNAPLPKKRSKKS